MLGKIRWELFQAKEKAKREWQARQRRSQPQGAVLMYHRIDKKDVDPWSLCVTPENFDAHLQVLKQQASPMSLRAFALAQRSGSLPDKAVAITFDDGYANNLYQAEPLLSKHQIPATVFVSTGYTDRGREFWWDELERFLLQPGTLPETLSLAISQEQKQWQLNRAATYTAQDHKADFEIAAWDARPGTRLRFYHDVWSALQPLSESHRQSALDGIAQWTHDSSLPRDSHKPMTRDELQQIEAGGVVSIGAHTVNHPLLFEQSIAQQQKEIADSKAYLEKVLNHSIEAFAYPFGAYEPGTVPLLKKADFLCACTTVEETVWSGNGCYELPRFDVGNWPKAVFEKQLRRWFETGYAA